MSATILPETPDGPVGRKPAIQARLAILVAHGLTRLPPGILESVMRRVVSRGKRPDPSTIVNYRAAVVRSSTICAGHGCLPRSVATALVARMNGYGVSWFTGIKIFMAVAGRPRVDETGGAPPADIVRPWHG